MTRGDLGQLSAAELIAILLQQAAQIEAQAVTIARLEAQVVEQQGTITQLQGQVKEQQARLKEPAKTAANSKDVFGLEISPGARVNRVRRVGGRIGGPSPRASGEGAGERGSGIG